MSPSFHALCATVQRDPALWGWLLAGWLAYVLGLGIWIVMQKREPAATLAWLIGLAALPYLGFVVYYVFGPQRIRRQRLRRGRARARLPATGVDEPPPHDEWAELARVAQASSRLPACTATSVRLLVDGGSTYDALLAAIAEARESIHLEYYIFEPDRSGAMLRDALAARARAGVKVRLLLDAVGSSRMRRRFLAPLEAAGAEVAWFHPMSIGLGRPWLNMRLHRKVVVIDDRIGFTGGVNISDEQDERLRDDAYHDLHLELRGEVVGQLQLVFAEDWVYATGQPPPLSAVRHEHGDVPAQVLVSGPDSPWETIHRTHVSAIYAARRRVWLATPYFVPGEAAMMALTSAAMGGLDVRLLVPKVSDSWLVTLAARSYFDELLEAGVRIHEYGPRMLHAKALLCDEETVIVGSANFDHRSFRLNFEMSVLLHDRALADRLAAQLEQDMARGPRVQARRRRSLWRVRLPEALARLLSPLL